MNMKTLKKITLAGTILSLICLMGCGSSKNTYDAAAAIADEAMMTDGGYSGIDSFESPKETLNESGTSSKPVIRDEKMIYRGDLSCETTVFDETLLKIHDLAKEYNAYFESDDTNVTSKKINADEYYRYSYMTVRVPAENFEAFVEGLESKCGMIATRKSISAENISEQYYDVAGRLEVYKNKQAKLNDMIKDAANVSELIEIENALSDVEYEIEYLQGMMNHYDSRVQYSTVTLNLQEVTALTMSVRTSTYGNKLIESFGNGCVNFIRFFGDLGLFVAGNCLFILLFVLAVFGIQKGYCRIKGREFKVNFCLKKREKNRQ